MSYFISKFRTTTICSLLLNCNLTFTISGNKYREIFFNTAIRKVLIYFSNFSRFLQQMIKSSCHSLSIRLWEIGGGCRQRFPQRNFGWRISFLEHWWNVPSSTGQNRSGYCSASWARWISRIRTSSVSLMCRWWNVRPTTNKDSIML